LVVKRKIVNVKNNCNKMARFSLVKPSTSNKTINIEFRWFGADNIRNVAYYFGALTSSTFLQKLSNNVSTLFFAIRYIINFDCIIIYDVIL
jgi:hypothetical protein